jgi:hypothetical protein
LGVGGRRAWGGIGEGTGVHVLPEEGQKRVGDMRGGVPRVDCATFVRGQVTCGVAGLAHGACVRDLLVAVAHEVDVLAGIELEQEKRSDPVRELGGGGAAVQLVGEANNDIAGLESDDACQGVEGLRGKGGRGMARRAVGGAENANGAGSNGDFAEGEVDGDGTGASEGGEEGLGAGIRMSVLIGGGLLIEDFPSSGEEDVVMGGGELLECVERGQAGRARRLVQGSMPDQEAAMRLEKESLPGPRECHGVGRCEWRVDRSELWRESQVSVVSRDRTARKRCFSSS